MLALPSPFHSQLTASTHTSLRSGNSLNSLLDLESSHLVSSFLPVTTVKVSLPRQRWGPLLMLWTSSPHLLKDSCFYSLLSLSPSLSTIPISMQMFLRFSLDPLEDLQLPFHFSAFYDENSCESCLGMLSSCLTSSPCPSGFAFCCLTAAALS